MNAITTLAAFTVLAAPVIAVAANTEEQPTSQNRPAPSLVINSCGHRDFVDFRQTTSTAFVAAAMQDGITEVALAGLALRKSHNEQIRQFAQRTIQDYAQSNGVLNSIVECEGLRLPVGLDPTHNMVVSSLNAKSGVAFDRAYLKHAVGLYSSAATLFELGSRSEDPDVAAFAQKCRLMHREHHLLVDNLRAGAGERTLGIR